MRRLLLLIFPALVLACGERPQADEGEETSGLRRYVLVDSNDCLHRIRACRAIREHCYRVDFIATSELTDADFDWYCAVCFTYADYKELQQMLDKE